MKRVEDDAILNMVPPMFYAGISNKFTKRHHSNFRDTTLTAASAAKERAERRLERQADAIEKQQQKIDNEMKKITEMSRNLHRQQLREANRLKNRLNYAASKLQTAYRCHLRCLHQQKREAAEVIQTMARGFLARRVCCKLRMERKELIRNRSSMVLSRVIRRYIARNNRKKELKHQHWAVCSIQSIARMVAARAYVHAQRRQRMEAERQYRAAVVLQSNVRAFMTRLIYLDVLYLICRIQAAMRGCLVRQRLRWIRAVDVDAISILQAHVRGFLVRKKTTSEQGITCQDAEPKTSQFHHRFALSALALKGSGGRASSFSSKSGAKPKSNMPTLARSSTGLGWQPKRSYWLPAGASFNRRLPVLPVPKRLMALDQVTVGNEGVLGDDFLTLNQSWTPKKRPLQKPCPARLSPVALPVNGKSAGRTLEELDQKVRDIEEEERLRRQESKRKFDDRRSVEKRRQVHESKLQREAKLEASERRLMEREEKLVRLQQKILCRRSREGKIRRLTCDQRQEERERLAMAREERHQRLHVKFCARQQLKRRQQLAIAPTTTSESETQPPSTCSSRYERKVRPTATFRQSKKKCDTSSENDGDLSFLDINFTIPTSMKPRNYSNASKKSSKLVHKKKKQAIRGVKKKNKITNRPTQRLVVKMAVEENECEYGDEFEDIVDEAALTPLMC